MSRPLISILMACYNSERFLRESIPNILSQTFQDFELIAVDDGSTDGTLDLLNEYAKHDRRIRVIVKEHTGLTDSLQYGLNVAQGEWIARWDADDLANPERLEQQFKYVQEHPHIVLVGSGCIEIDTSGRAIKKHIYPISHQALVRNLEQLKKFFPHSSALFNRRKALAVEGYRKRFIYAQDRDLWLRLAEVGEIACLPVPLVYLRRHTETISHKYSSLQILLSVAATVCHIRRIHQLSDPSNMEEPVWQDFLRWLKMRLEQEGILSDEAIWMELRALRYANLDVRDQITALMKLIKHFPIVIRRLRRLWQGSDIVFRLAKEWPGFSGERHEQGGL